MRLGDGAKIRTNSVIPSVAWESRGSGAASFPLGDGAKSGKVFLFLLRPQEENAHYEQV